MHPDPEAAIDLDQLLGEWFNDEFPTWNFADLVPLTRQVFDTGCNWKLAMDTFGETYHFSVLHKDTLFNAFHANVQCYDEAGHLHRMILCKRDIDAMRLLPEEQWDITVAGLPLYWIFPNVILLPFDAGCFLVRAYPDRNDPGRHVSRVSFYLKPALAAMGDEITAFAADIAEKFSHVIRDEDYAMATSQQTAANSGAMSHVIFGRNEPALHHYHNTYLALLGLEQLPLLDEAAVTSVI